MGPKDMIIEMQAAPDEIENFIELVRSFGIKEIQRTGTVALKKD
jgi:acetolactate synthase-1/3 small subunit